MLAATSSEILDRLRGIHGGHKKHGLLSKLTGIKPGDESVRAQCKELCSQSGISSDALCKLAGSDPSLARDCDFLSLIDPLCGLAVYLLRKLQTTDILIFNVWMAIAKLDEQGKIGTSADSGILMLIESVVHLVGAEKTKVLWRDFDKDTPCWQESARRCTSCAERAQECLLKAGYDNQLVTTVIQAILARAQKQLGVTIDQAPACEGYKLHKFITHTWGLDVGKWKPFAYEISIVDPRIATAGCVLDNIRTLGADQILKQYLGGPQV